MRLQCTRNAFLLQGIFRAWEGANEVCRREWGRSVPQDFMWRSGRLAVCCMHESGSDPLLPFEFPFMDTIRDADEGSL
jgi:hypothetical protein